MSLSGKFVAGGAVLIILGSIADRPPVAGLGVWVMIGVWICRWLAKKAAESTVRQPEVLVVTEAAVAVVDRFVLPVFCAKTDCLFLTVFERTDPRRMFRITAIGPAPEGTGIAAARTVSVNELDLDDFRCPFCAAREYIRCSRCEMPVCAGRVTRVNREEIFECRVSCGRRGKVSSTLTEAKGADGGRTGVVSVRQRGFIARGGN